MMSPLQAKRDSPSFGYIKQPYGQGKAGDNLSMPTKKIAKPKAPEDPAVRAYYERFQARLKAFRKAAGLSQAQFADLLDIPLANYKQIESGRMTRFPLHRLEKLSSAVRESYEFIITGKNSRKAAEDERRRATVSLVRN